MATYPIGALDEKSIVPFGTSLADELLSPFLLMFLLPCDINLSLWFDKSAGVIQAIFPPKLSACVVEGVPPETISPISPSVLIVQPCGRFGVSPLLSY